MYTIDENGDVELIQGDTLEYPITGLPTDKNYTACFAIQDERRKPIGSEIVVNTNGVGALTFVISSSITDSLEVKPTDQYATYYFGIKLCAEGVEDTLLLGNGNIGDLNTITVYPKKVEGV